MKKTIRFTALTLAAIILASLCSCGLFGKESLYEHGMDLIDLMLEKAKSEAYLEVYGLSDNPNSDILTFVNEFDFDKPDAVYSVTLDEEDLICSLMDDEDFLDGLSKDLKNTVENNALNSLISRLNIVVGNNAVMTASALSSEKVFVDKSLKENVLYIYDFEGAYPVAVAFTKGEGNAVKAFGSFIFYEDFPSHSEEAIAAFFEQEGIEVKVKSVKIAD